MTVSSVGFAARASTWFFDINDRGSEMVWRGTLDALGMAGGPGGRGQPLKGTYASGQWLVRFWTLIPVVLVLASLASCAVAAITMVYLAMRRVCDGQDVAELWVPGMVERNMRDALDSRAKVAAEHPGPRPGAATSDLNQADYE
jgi:hypothetical protein